jgi:hypothetical protein
MDADYIQKYEDLYQTDVQQHELEHSYGPGGSKTYIYAIDFGVMKQTNQTTGRTRSIRRVTAEQFLE